LAVVVQCHYRRNGSIWREARHFENQFGISWFFFAGLRLYVRSTFSLLPKGGEDLVVKHLSRSSINTDIWVLPPCGKNGADLGLSRSFSILADIKVRKERGWLGSPELTDSVLNAYRWLIGLLFGGFWVQFFCCELSPENFNALAPDRGLRLHTGG
jgi:hypothetical protein